LSYLLPVMGKTIRYLWQQINKEANREMAMKAEKCFSCLTGKN